MKKLALLLTLALCINELKAQTKEETIKWLTDKFEMNMEGYYASRGPLFYRQTPQTFTLNECELIVKIKEESSFSGGGTWYYDLTIPMHDLIIRNDGSFSNYGIKKVMTETTYRDKSSIGAEKVLTDTKGWVKINSDKEKDILERMRKAFDHLATFCPKKKETF